MKEVECDKCDNIWYVRSAGDIHKIDYSKACDECVSSIVRKA